MMEISRNVMAVLLILFILVSVIGTWSVLTSLSALEMVSPFQPGLGPGQATVTLQVPVKSSLQGQVQVLVT